MIINKTHIMNYLKAGCWGLLRSLAQLLTRFHCFSLTSLTLNWILSTKTQGFLVFCYSFQNIFIALIIWHTDKCTEKSLVHGHHLIKIIQIYQFLEMILSKIRSQEHKTIFELITYMVVVLVPECVWRLCCLRDLMKQMRSYLSVSNQMSLVYIHIFISTPSTAQSSRI